MLDVHKAESFPLIIIIIIIITIIIIIIITTFILIKARKSFYKPHLRRLLTIKIKMDYLHLYEDTKILLKAIIS